MNRGPMASLLRSTLTMLLAGGQGERLYPLTRDRAKPAVPFAGIYRIIDFTLSNCINSNLRKIYVLTQYKSDSLNKHLRLGWNIFSEELDEFIITVPPQFRGSDHWYKGTADAIFQNIYTLQAERPERVLVLSGDHIYRMDYGEMLQFHEDNQADLTIAAVIVGLDEARGFGVMGVDSERRIVDFQEKPERPEPYPEQEGTALVSMGVYVFNTPVLVKAVSEDARRNSAHDFGKDIIPRLIQNGRVFAYPFVGEGNRSPYWRDVGTLDSYYEANMDMVSITPAFNLYDPEWPYRTYHASAPPAKTILADEASGLVGSAIESMISNGCVISGGRVQKSILSPNVRIESHARVEESILMEGVYVGAGARLRRVIIDKGVSVPDGSVIGYDSEADKARFVTTEKGIVVVPKGMLLY